jgi:RNA-binding protein YhbY
MKPIKHLQIGKNGLTLNVVEQARKMLEKEKAIKITILKSATRDRKEAKELAEKLAFALGSNFQYRLIGYTIVLKRYRKNSLLIR